MQMALFKGVDHNKESVSRIGNLVGYMYCEFFITKTQSQKERRIIIYQSTHFFRDYKIDDKFSVIFPQERYDDDFRTWF